MRLVRNISVDCQRVQEFVGIYLDLSRSGQVTSFNSSQPTFAYWWEFAIIRQVHFAKIMTATLYVTNNIMTAHIKQTTKLTNLNIFI